MIRDMGYLIRTLSNDYKWLNSQRFYEGEKLIFPKIKHVNWLVLKRENITEDELEYHFNIGGTLTLLSFEDELRSLGQILQGCESPIERVFISAFWLVACATFTDLGYRIVNLRHTYPVDGVEDNTFLFITPQAQIESIRVDFLLTHFGAWPNFDVEKVSNNGLSIPGTSFCRVRAVVECDGHDFHEKTKEQATRDKSRDRLLMRRGFRVFRFSGSEIYRAPIQCAYETAKALYDLAWDVATPSSG